MEHLRKLPPVCVARMDGRSVRICRGQSEVEPIDNNEMWVRWNNYTRGITDEQVQAMMNGILFGWDHPSTHIELPLYKMTVEVPVTAIMEVEAYSIDDAVEQARKSLVLPDNMETSDTVAVTKIEAKS